jgi:hypothetical protein
MNLAPGVEFFEVEHQYYLNGRELSGVTRLISGSLDLTYPAELMAEHQVEGIHVHKAIQQWITTGDSGSRHPGVAWIVKTLPDRTLDATLYSEVLVSDLKQYASAVDLVVERGERLLDLYDFKKGQFKRAYVSAQLGIYKYLIEANTEYRVNRCYCACLRDCEYYPIIPTGDRAVVKLLYG